MPTATTDPLLADLIDIPEAATDEDFVLKIVEGTSGRGARRTVDDYVITEQVADRLDDALEVIRSGMGLIVDGEEVREGTARPGTGCYLHGSFGSGKSHFMAFLHRLLTGDEAALARPELARVVRRHRPWMRDRRFLLVPCHMIGASGIEDRLYEGYLKALRVAEEAGAASAGSIAPPVLFQADRLLATAEDLRNAMGDAKFFEVLGDTEADEGWGDVGGGGSWTPERYERARTARHDDADREALVIAIKERILPHAGGTLDAPLPFDEGLERISAHAAEAGYDGIVLFLDELILWLAGRASDTAFLSREVEKLVQLIEGQRMNRPTPVIAFIARQKNLQELVGDHAVGAELAQIDHQLQHHEGRFSQVLLELMDLPEIAAHRLLRPKDDAARAELDRRFAQLATRGDVLNTLRGEHHDREDFRKVYPFSPVLVDALVATSSLLQRDRTALKAMLTLLVANRSTLRVGEIIPVGDLWSVISRGGQAITTNAKALFDSARKIRDEQLLPLVLKELDLGSEDEANRLPDTDPRKARFRADRRIIDTLLLAAIAPKVPALQDLDAHAIVQLNHGTIRASVPGTEAAQVLGRVRAWAERVASLQLEGDQARPRIRIALDSVDIGRILAGAASADTPERRVRLVRELIGDDLGVEVGGEGERRLHIEWRGFEREVEVVFGNVSTLPLASLEHAPAGADAAAWKLIIDEPLDAQRQPLEANDADDAKLREFVARGVSARTLVWRPRFLNERGLDDLGRLAKLERVLQSDTTFQEHAGFLSPEDQIRARTLLRSQRETLRLSLKSTLRIAYGLGRDDEQQKKLDETVEVETFRSLDPTFIPRPPANVQSLKAGIAEVLEQGFEHLWPKAPRFGRMLKTADARHTLELHRRALADPQKRASLESREKTVATDVLMPLELGKVAGAYAPDDTWYRRFQRRAESEGGLDGGATVRQLRRWVTGDGAAVTETDGPRGLPQRWADVVIIAFSESSQFAIERHGRTLESPGPDDLRPEDLVRPVPLPKEETWERARELAGALLGASVESLFLTSGIVEAWRRRVVDAASESAGASPLPGDADLDTASSAVWRRLGQQLTDLQRSLQRRWELVHDPSSPRSVRLTDLQSALDVVEMLGAAENARDLVERMASLEFEPPSSADSVGAMLKQSRGDLAALEAANWDLIAGALERDHAEAPDLRDRLHGLLSQQAHVTQLAAELPAIERLATKIMVKPVTPPPPPPPPPPPGRSGTARLRPESSTAEIADAIETFRREHPDRTIEVTWTVVDADA